MINGSFVFGMDEDGPDVFSRTVDWAISQGIETATFHILTPYPDTALHVRMLADGRILHSNWDQYDTRHTVFQSARMTPEQLEEGYWRAYRDFYRWSSILKGSTHHKDAIDRLRHFTYSVAWKKLEPAWDLIIRAKRVSSVLPLLEKLLSRKVANDLDPGDGTQRNNDNHIALDPATEEDQMLAA
jgi:radical SAM superfamily enzyme YgiQ (UPF0313 family)